MKIAGKKNDGAWFRANRAIHGLNSTERANLVGSIAASDYIDAAFNGMTTMMAEVGVTSNLIPASTQEWANNMGLNGIPRQVWMGKLSWTTYEKIGGKYVPVGQSEMHYFAQDLRNIVSRFLLARRQARDIFDKGSRAEGNPSGQPDSLVNS